jgi:hypothetical protein
MYIKNMNAILRYRFILLLLTGVFAFAACNEEEHDPFAGKDSFITAFSLKQGETVFTADIAEDLITVKVPEGLSLAQAKATVKLSENATVYPDPAEITDWNIEHLFVVTAYNRAQTKYKYTVERSGVAHEGTVTLETQADVDAFGQQEFTFIDGNLTIGRNSGTDSITSLTPLEKLTGVGYTLSILPTCAFANLDGLHNLEHVGTLQIIANEQNLSAPHLETLNLPTLKTAGNINVKNTVSFFVELPELESVSNSLSLDCPLSQIQLRKLKYAGSLTLTAASNANTALTQISLPSLEEVEGDIHVGYLKSITKIEFPELKKTGGFFPYGMISLLFVNAPKLEEITGKLEIQSVNALVEMNLPELKKAGELFISADKLSLLEVSKLETVKSLTVYDTQLDGINGFTSLKTVETLSLNRNVPKTSIVKLPDNVQRVDVFSVSATNKTIPSVIDVRGKNIGKLAIVQYAMQAKLVGDEVFHGILSLDPGNDIPFPELEGFKEVDSLYFYPFRMSEIHIAGIRKVNRGVYIQGAYTAIKNFSMSIEETGGNLIVNIPSMTATPENMDSIKIDRLRSVGGNLELTFYTKAIKALSCPELTAVGGNFNLSTGYDEVYETTVYHRGFETLSFPKLKSIGGKLYIFSDSTYEQYNNDYLQNLDGFAELSAVKQIEIRHQKALTDYSGLKNAFRSLASENDWTVSDNAYNPSCQDLSDGKWTK